MNVTSPILNGLRCGLKLAEADETGCIFVPSLLISLSFIFGVSRQVSTDSCVFGDPIFPSVGGPDRPIERRIKASDAFHWGMVFDGIAIFTY